ncbi:hypothetical protein MMYC01_204408 [Madurella mycetomatis]|uniref:Bacteriophage T5 Orf172 DNA-binding domain-containing protein n=1 Tax=Madurella mycetomatis TaxID=100816 RepID=A0A175W5P5_9PEZI|nr:hypothetical protein MMYC01_204408 [Madurella mycetomatis]
MPFFANTPESRLGRSDSKNPSSTCRGVTSSGLPCRRAIAADGDNESFYCWQHKDQASASANSTPGPKKTHTPILEERTSLDTLAERLGLAARPESKEFFSCCCLRIPLDDFSPPPRPRPQPIQPTTVSTPPRPSGKKHSSQYLSPSPRPSPSPGRPSRRGSDVSQTAQFMSLIPHDAPPQTASQLLAELAKPISEGDEAGYIYIFWLTPESEPATPPAEAARSLLAPPATPNRNGRRPSEVLRSFARTIGDDDDDDDDEYVPDDYVPSRRPGDDSRRSGNKKKQRDSSKNKKILLKIGRATNVQRRLNEWQRQCGYNLSLIRYYPYVPSGSPAAEPRKIPHSHKVERLVHIELTGRGFRVTDREKCEACGKEHREWFEVEASRTAVAEVDDVVRRWSDWDESQG